MFDSRTLNRWTGRNIDNDTNSNVNINSNSNSQNSNSHHHTFPEVALHGIPNTRPADEDLGGNHLSKATCPTQVFFKSGESCSILN